MAPEASYVLKFNRSQEHLVELDARLAVWRDGHRYSTRLEPDPNNPLCRVLKASADPIPEETFSPIIGDLVQNLRASLDHMVFALSEKHSGTLSKEQAKIPKFPIFGDEKTKPAEGFANASRTSLRFVSPEARAVIEGLQPYKVIEQSGGSADYTDSHLWRLHELSNLDKHQSIHLVTIVPSGFRFGGGELFTGAFSWFPGVPVGRDTVIASVHPRAGVERGEVDMEIEATLEVAFRDEPLASHPVIETLEQICAWIAFGVLKPLEAFL